jgi:hypothetical protein
MSEPNTPTPGSGGGIGGPISRPDGAGVPPGAGGSGVEGGGGEDSRDPGMAGEGDIGEDTGGRDSGMLGEG